MSAFTFAQLVDSMIAQGVPPERAQRFAREQLGDTDEPIVSRNARILEKAEQTAIRKLFIEYGFKVRSTSSVRPSKIAIGFPDLFVTHATMPLGFFWETKRQVGGVVSEAQEEFGADCWRCGIRWYTGDRFDAQSFLEKERIRRRE